MNCPTCQATLDCHQSVDDPDADLKPKPGDLSVCFYCGEILTMTESCAFKVYTEDELKKLTPTLFTQLEMARNAIRKLKKMN